MVDNVYSLLGQATTDEYRRSRKEERKGIRELVRKECDEIIQINMKNNLKFEIDSLNVSNATSIALYQFYST